ncbi:MAG: dihydrolipoamide acetyltransferase family protein [Bacteroidales bacterium]
MTTPVIMPKQGQSVETCLITTWFRQKGDAVKTGDILCSYETDKASFDLESPADGILLEIFYHDGDEVPVLETIAVIGPKGEDTERYKPGTALKSKSASEELSAESEHEPPVTAAGVKAPDSIQGKIKISPRARKLAAAENIDPINLTGTGPGGRIIVRDVENAIKEKSIRKAEPPAFKTIDTVLESEFADKPITNIRRIIASAMHTSLQNSAQLTHHMSADARKMLEARKKIKEQAASEKEVPDITLNDIICYCVIKALKKFPEMNSHFLGESIRTFKGVHLGLAVDTMRGLMVPVIRNADRLNLTGLSKELKEAAEACRRGSFDPELLKSTSASFTVTNLGAYGVEMFTPVLNLPQVGILGVCTITHRPADLGNGVMGFVPVIGLSLTYDHRAIDGGPATLFLKEIKEQIENFE